MLVTSGTAIWLPARLRNPGAPPGPVGEAKGAFTSSWSSSCRTEGRTTERVGTIWMTPGRCPIRHSMSVVTLLPALLLGELLFFVIICLNMSHSDAWNALREFTVAAQAVSNRQHATGRRNYPFSCKPWIALSDVFPRARSDGALHP